MFFCLWIATNLLRYALQILAMTDIPTPLAPSAREGENFGNSAKGGERGKMLCKVGGIFIVIARIYEVNSWQSTLYKFKKKKKNIFCDFSNIDCHASLTTCSQ
ncbi:hypothetical protein [Helicobacter sp. T3_23-1056]